MIRDSANADKQEWLDSKPFDESLSKPHVTKVAIEVLPLTELDVSSLSAEFHNL
ncbi:hypothetical protein GMA19_00673 [Paenibacillus polymyxa E681]|nr:hypothetical protein GE561_00674 [Paenibacillus polymyxa E681]QNV60360.1 hypothetical protein GMA19_00673 [Paenibacillus polymyxa E681]